MTTNRFGGDSRYMADWMRRYGGGRPQTADANARARRECALAGPLSGRGPFVRLTLEWMRGDPGSALALAQALDAALDFTGVRLPGEPEGRA